MKTVHDHDSQNHNRASDRREDAFCVAEPRFAAASLAYQLADMAQTVPGHDSQNHNRASARRADTFIKSREESLATFLVFAE